MSDLRKAAQWMPSLIVSFNGLPRPYGYWTRERCIEDAKRFTSRNKWDRNSRGAFQAARRAGWTSAFQGVVGDPLPRDTNHTFDGVRKGA